MNERNKNRAADSTSLSVSMPKALRDRIKAAAEKDRRSVSQWLAIQMESILAEATPNKSSAPIPGTVRANANRGVSPESPVRDRR